MAGVQAIPACIFSQPVSSLTQIEHGEEVRVAPKVLAPVYTIMHPEVYINRPLVAEAHSIGQPMQIAPIAVEQWASPFKIQAPFQGGRAETISETETVSETGIDAPEDFEAKVSLPPESSREGWSLFEKDLYLQSDGLYHPGKMAQRRRPPAHDPSTAWRGNGRSQQTWPDKELIVVETYTDSPSAFLEQTAKEDPRLVHVRFKVDPDEDFSVGLKRNMTLHLASGEFIANFDDDDVYAPAYVTKMVTHLQEHDLTAVTLSHWYNYFVRDGSCGFSDKECWDVSDLEELEEVLYGYGFSYVHRRHEALLMPYPNVDFAEDAPFMLTLRQVLGDHKVGLKNDEEGLCMHIIHRANSTGDPDYARKVGPSEIRDLEVASSPQFRQYLDSQPPMCWLSSLPPLPFPLWPWSSVLSATCAVKKEHASCA